MQTDQRIFFAEREVEYWIGTCYVGDTTRRRFVSSPDGAAARKIRKTTKSKKLCKKTQREDLVFQERKATPKRGDFLLGNIY